MKRIMAGICMVACMAIPAFAQDFLLGEETKGAKVQVTDDAYIRFRVRLQPRIDGGDIIEQRTDDGYDSTTDMYMRRIRFEIGGKMTKKLSYVLVLEGDRYNQTDRGSSSFEPQYAFLDYKFSDPAALLFGRAKLPYSRISLVSSSRQLLIERPYFVNDAGGLFGDYYQTQLQFHGKVADGVFKYHVTAADGLDRGDEIGPAAALDEVHKSDSLYVLRAEFSPPGWVEKKKSDAHLEGGKHLVLGVNYAAQGGIEYTTAATTEEDRSLMGFDVSFHMGGLNAAFEYLAGEVKINDAANVEPEGWYIQAGYVFSGIFIEPAFRYEEYDHDSNQSDQKQKVTTVGLNWYPKGHSFKLMGNWVFEDFDSALAGAPGLESRDTWQIQAQMYF